MPPNDLPETSLELQGIDELKPNEPQEIDEVISVKVKSGEAEWTALAGPNVGQAEPAEIMLTEAPAALRIVSGWLYQWGKLPAGKTKRVSAGATGTTMLVQHEGPRDAGIHRVFFIAKDAIGDSVEVTLDANPNAKRVLHVPGTYIEIGPADTELPLPSPIETASAAVKAVVQHAQTEAQAAGVP